MNLSNNEENENSIADLQINEDSIDTVNEGISNLFGNSMATVDEDSMDTVVSLDTVVFDRTFGMDVYTSSNNSSPGNSNAIISDQIENVPLQFGKVLDLSGAGGHALD